LTEELVVMTLLEVEARLEVVGTSLLDVELEDTLEVDDSLVEVDDSLVEEEALLEVDEVLLEVDDALLEVEDSLLGVSSCISSVISALAARCEGDDCLLVVLSASDETALLEVGRALEDDEALEDGFSDSVLEVDTTEDEEVLPLPSISAMVLLRPATIDGRAELLAGAE